MECHFNNCITFLLVSTIRSNAAVDVWLQICSYFYRFLVRTPPPPWLKLKAYNQYSLSSWFPFYYLEILTIQGQPPSYYFHLTSDNPAVFFTITPLLSPIGHLMGFSNRTSKTWYLPRKAPPETLSHWWQIYLSNHSDQSA